MAKAGRENVSSKVNLDDDSWEIGFENVGSGPGGGCAGSGSGDGESGDGGFMVGKTRCGATANLQGCVWKWCRD